jgi:hypothetical protein
LRDKTSEDSANSSDSEGFMSSLSAAAANATRSELMLLMLLQLRIGRFVTGSGNSGRKALRPYGKTAISQSRTDGVVGAMEAEKERMDMLVVAVAAALTVDIPHPTYGLPI